MQMVSSAGSGLAVALAKDVARDLAGISTSEEKQYLLPELEATADGSGPVIETEPKSLTLTLGVTSSLANEELEVFVWGSADGQNWGKGPLAKFRRQHCCGFSRLPLDLQKLPGIRHLQVKWRVSRWGEDRGRLPLFGFYVAMA